MKSLAVAALLAATPALAATEVYQCSNPGGPAFAVAVDVTGDYFAVLENGKPRVLCAKGVKDCPRMVDGGYTHIADAGITLFDAGKKVFQNGGWGKAVKQPCTPADAATRGKFAG